MIVFRETSDIRISYSFPNVTILKLCFVSLLFLWLFFTPRLYWGRYSFSRLVTWISEIGYLLLPSRDMAEIPTIWGRYNFPIHFWGRDVSEKVWNRFLGSSGGRYGDLFKWYKITSSECYNWSDITLTCGLIAEIVLNTQFDILLNTERIPFIICNGSGMTINSSLTIRSCQIYDLHMFLLRPFFPKLVFLDFEFRKSLSTCILLHIKQPAGFIHLSTKAVNF